MTIPIERTRAVLQTHEFLIDIQTGKFPRIPKSVRAEASRLLRHYPNAYDLYLTSAHWGDNQIIQCPFADPDEKF